MRRRQPSSPASSAAFVSKDFGSFTEFVNAAATGEDLYAESSWAGGVTLAEAVDLARRGWPEGWQRMKALRDAIFARMASRIHKDVVQFRIAGGAVNVGRYLSGRPDCFAARVRSNQLKDLRSRKVVRMVVNVGARASVSADTIFARGAAAVTLIEALERAGLRVQVEMVTLATDRAGKHVRLATRLKEAGEVLQLDKLAFSFAHPALHRKLNFALRKQLAGWIGGSIDLPLEERGDIYLDAADTTANVVWRDAAEAQKWVVAQLASPGIAMTAA
jgi:hypothetical protein